MTGDIPSAALRLMSTLTVRTVCRTPPERREYGTGRRIIKKPGIGRGNNQGRAVRIGKREFPSMKEACRIMNIGHATFYVMIADGRAVRI